MVRSGHFGLVVAAFTFALALTVTGGCRRDDRSGEPTSVSTVTAAEHPAEAVTVQPGGSPPLAERSQNLKRMTSFREGLSAPSAVIHDRDRDRYLVSNVAGKLTEADGNGFISAFSAGGKIKNSRFITAGLNAPKGLAITNQILYVADIDVVRRFDVESGAPLGVVRIPNATYLVGMAAAADGRVFVSDAGMTVTKNGDLEARRQSHGGAIWSIGGFGPPSKVPAKDSLDGPAALLAHPNGDLVVATLGSGAIYTLSPDGTKRDELKAPHGRLDGIAEQNGDLYVASWDAAAVYRRPAGGTFSIQLANVRSPGAVAIDSGRSWLLLPMLADDSVDAFLIE
jgi:hypothetical protein